MNRKKRKPALILLVAVLCAIVLLGIRGTRKTIDKTSWSCYYTMRCPCSSDGRAFDF